MKRSEQRAEQKKKEQERENERRIAETIVSLDKATNTFKAYITALDAEIDEAAMNGDDKLAEEILFCQAEAMDIARAFVSIKTSLKTQAITAKAAGSLASLPAYIKGCQNILSTMPKFGSLSKDLSVLKDNLGKAKEQLSDLRGALSVKDDISSITASVGAAKTDSDSYQKCKAAMEARLAAKLGVATNPVAAPANNVAAAPANNVAGNAGANGGNGGAGIGDVLGMISDVNNGGNGGNN